MKGLGQSGNQRRWVTINEFLSSLLDMEDDYIKAIITVAVYLSGIHDRAVRQKTLLNKRHSELEVCQKALEELSDHVK